MAVPYDLLTPSLFLTILVFYTTYSQGLITTERSVSSAGNPLVTSRYNTFQRTTHSSSTGHSLTFPVARDNHSETEDFMRDLHLDNDNVTRCVDYEQFLSFRVTNGEILMNHNFTKFVSKVRTCHIRLEVPPGRVLAVEILLVDGECTCREEALLIIADTKSGYSQYLFLSKFCYGSPVHPVFTASEITDIEIEFDFYSSCYMHLNFTAVPSSQRPLIEIIYTSNTTGYLQSPGFDGESPHPPSVDSTVHLLVPAYHDVMLGFDHMDLIDRGQSCNFHSVSLYIGNDDPGSRVWEACTYNLPPVDLYRARIVYLRFYSVRISDLFRLPTGFRLLFSFHNHTSLLRKLPDGKWNCSVPYFAEYQSYFRCDITQDCAGAEDERNCTHTSETCGPGYISVGGGCYQLLSKTTKITGDDANELCSQAGGHVVSFNTPKEWYDVIEILGGVEFDFYVGFRSVGPASPDMYKYYGQWTDGCIAYYVFNLQGVVSEQVCSYFEARYGWVMAVNCRVPFQRHVLCEFERKNQTVADVKLPDLSTSPSTFPVPHVVCPKGHVTHQFLSCDVRSACWGSGYGSSASCDAPLTPLPPSFACTNGIEHVPYTLVCDFTSHCHDNSDEDFCVFPPCGVKEFECGNGQCLPPGARCDKTEQCQNGVDEKWCLSTDVVERLYAAQIPPPAQIDFDGTYIYVNPLGNESFTCPDTHFQCPDDGYCMPVYVRCNGAYDCPGKEDEADCDSYTCPGFYRCRGSQICLHPDHMCDNISHCPQRDDELLCDLLCPQNCTCYGRAFFCHHYFKVGEYPDVRYLDLEGSGMKLEDFVDNKMLIYLSLAHCGLTELQPVDLPNLRTLDLSDNNITTVSVRHLLSIPALAYLSLSANPLLYSFLTDRTMEEHVPVTMLDLSRSQLPEIDVTLFSMFPDLHTLNLSQSGTQRVSGQGFQSLKKLQHLDLRGCPMVEFSRDIFKGLDQLDTVYADNYKLCCKDTLPEGFNLAQCHVPTDEISSCEALLRSDIYRVVLAVFAVLALLGNLGSFVYRVIINRSKRVSGFSVFVTHLCVSDFLMGVYLSVIGVADRIFLGSYLWNDLTWRGGVACQMAGFVSFLSSEVSAFLICLITLDRFLVLRFPFRAVHFRKFSAHIACGLVWFAGLVLAGLPFLITSYRGFYSQTGICIPLPVTRKEFSGQDYSFGVMIVLNFVLFLLIAAGQVSIYWSIQANSMSTNDVSKDKSKELTIARRLLTVVISDFLCWFPIGLSGLLASNGVVVPGEVNVSMAIIVLPLNSALNPFLYTVNAVMERRRQKREAQLLQRLSNTLKNTPGGGKKAYTKGEAWALFEKWVADGLLHRQEVTDHLGQGKS